MKFQLYIQCDKAVFDENPAREVSRILAEISQKIESRDEVPTYFQTIYDVNGNDVGRYAIKPDDYEFYENGEVA